jgi:hypothetical protein
MNVASTVTTRPRAAEVRSTALGQWRVLTIPLVFIVAEAGLAWLPSISANPRLFWSIESAAAALFAGFLALIVNARHRRLSVTVVLRAQHYLQACAQASVLAYWGWYWRPVYDALPLIASQLLFAYAFDMLLSWWRRDDYTLGFAPFPVIFSINLFLWFKPDWFYLQFLMIALGFAAKELIRWEKGGRRAHIFNPSSFPLAVFSVALLLTGTTSWTWGPEIASTQFNPPNIYLFLFLVGLPGQVLFGVTTMTMSAVVTTYLFGLLYFWTTGAYFFIDSYIPIAVFLGMHLLFTDPSTSPRTEIGRIMFGVLYGLGNIILYELLGRAGMPTFYDKLLPVPLMNLSIRLIDRVASAGWLKNLDPAKLAGSLAGRRRNLAYVALWSAVFAAMSATDAVGDAHPGHRVPFWQQACLKDARNACANLASILEIYCKDGSGWSCNEVGVLRFHGRAAGADLVSDFKRSCAAGFPAGCRNVITMQTGLGTPIQGRPRLQDYPIVLRTGKGALAEREPVDLLTRACDQGWMTGCDDLGALFLRGQGIPRDAGRAAAAFERACDGGLAIGCSNLGLMHYSADGIPKDTTKGLAYLKQACGLGLSNACRWLEQYR